MKRLVKINSDFTMEIVDAETMTTIVPPQDFHYVIEGDALAQCMHWNDEYVTASAMRGFHTKIKSDLKVDPVISKLLFNRKWSIMPNCLGVWYNTELLH
jgi:hypothetical protein